MDPAALVREPPILPLTTQAQEAEALTPYVELFSRHAYVMAKVQS